MSGCVTGFLSGVGSDDIGGFFIYAKCNRYD